MRLVFVACVAWSAGIALADFELKVGRETYDVFVAEPTNADGRPPLVIYHHGQDLEGLDRSRLERLARRFSTQGYVFWAPKRRPGGDIRAAIEIGEAILARAKDDPKVDPDRIALIGFSQGSVVALVTGARSPQVKAICVLAFEVDDRAREAVRDVRYGEMAASVLIQQAEKDATASPGDDEAVESALREAGKNTKRLEYPDLARDDLAGDGTHVRDMLKFLRDNLH